MWYPGALVPFRSVRWFRSKCDSHYRMVPTYIVLNTNTELTSYGQNMRTTPCFWLMLGFSLMWDPEIISTSII